MGAAACAMCGKSETKTKTKDAGGGPVVEGRKFSAK